MAFKKVSSHADVASNPAAHFKTLTKRNIPDVMPHQKEILETYSADYIEESSVALQLPTGSGKTLVGLLIADWRRRVRNERAVYLCPTRQLVSQTVRQAVEQYGIDAVDLSGSKSSFDANDYSAFKTGNAVAVCTYSGMFNTNPAFDGADLIIVDDAHAAENYVSKMWSLEIQANHPLHNSLSEFLRQHISAQSHARLTGNWHGPEDATWVDMIPSPIVVELEEQLVEIIDAHATPEDKEIYYPWSLLREKLAACQVYIGSNQILIRPILPPTWDHTAFSSAKQRIFMSATLGAGGDLERLLGVKNVRRLPAPEGFQSAGVGRRFFLFPSLSLDGNETEKLCCDLVNIAGRSVILTPSTPQADAHKEQIEQHLSDHKIFLKDQIEHDKTPFVKADKAVSILANRFDGIDFPGDECRLLRVDGLPTAMNIQEKFLMSKMAASSLFHERIQTRVLQAIGRCSRALQDRSAVVISGIELVDYLADNRNWNTLHPEIQAELNFGVEQSMKATAENFLENFQSFLANNADWEDADKDIRSDTISRTRSTPREMTELEDAVKHEIDYQSAVWSGDFAAAQASAELVVSKLNLPQLRGYRALWHYLAGCAALRLSAHQNDAHGEAALEHFRSARGAAPAVAWLNELSRRDEANDNAKQQQPADDAEVLQQVEGIERQFLSIGRLNSAKLEKRLAEIQTGLSAPASFEEAQRKLGELLGFVSGNDETDAAPDPWWLGTATGIVFEDHVGANPETILDATKARQAHTHPNWIAENVSCDDDIDVTAVLVTPCTSAKTGAKPHLTDVRIWPAEDFNNWASNALNVLRDLHSQFPGEGDLIWRADAAQRLDRECMTITQMLNRLNIAAESMQIVD